MFFERLVAEFECDPACLPADLGFADLTISQNVQKTQIRPNDCDRFQLNSGVPH